ncbi:hypothetical protein [Prochlorococcus marinus]|uniref:hypothetical protein n=1 Tax=Prochlorococcus marinus TaxID=1219 RepID=UPI0022B55A29|nr:hypothetical protein [Prochlorococcus marinus]
MSEEELNQELSTDDLKDVAGAGFDPSQFDNSTWAKKGHGKGEKPGAGYSFNPMKVGMGDSQFEDPTKEAWRLKKKREGKGDETKK